MNAISAQSVSPRWIDVSVHGPAAMLPIATPRPPLDLARLAWSAFWIIALLLLNKLGEVGTAIFFMILACMALGSSQGAYKAMAICFLGLMVNVNFVPKSLIWTPARLVLPALALVRFGIDLFAAQISLRPRGWHVALFVFVVTMAVASIVSGWFTHIALLKLFNFILVVTAVFTGVRVFRARRLDPTEWVIAMVLAVAILGVASVALGYSDEFYRFGKKIDGFFIGAFMHPNCHTLFGGMCATFAATTAVLGRYRNRWILLPLIVTWVIFMLWSRARSSIFSTATGLTMLCVYARPLRNTLGWRLHVNLSRGKLAALGAASFVALALLNIATQGTVSQSIVAFVNKSKAQTGAFEADLILGSRTALIELSLKHFRDNPVTGIGFQVSMTPEFARSATLFTAPAEKGFLPTAILEEGGVLGTVAFVVFVLLFIRAQWRDRNVPGLVGFATFLATNLGEVSIFSMGGPGAFGWMMVGASIMLGDHCWQRTSEPSPHRALQSPAREA